jgi:Arc/MetJ-type ribon-helix-helix transcriptional regulator
VRVVTIHLHESTVQLLDRLLQAGIFPNKAEAIRFIIVNYIPDLLGLYKLLPEKQPTTIINISKEGMFKQKGNVITSFKISPTLLELLNQVYERAGYMSRSEFIRAAIVKKVLEVL